MSPVHDQSYRRYVGQKQPGRGAARVILRTGVRALLTRRVFVALCLFFAAGVSLVALCWGSVAGELRAFTVAMAIAGFGTGTCASAN